jgi:hypothetical protein
MLVPVGPAAIRAALLPTARRWRERLDNREVRQARHLMRVAQNGRLDVLYLADSMATFISPQDTDRRSFRQMLAEALAPDLSFFCVEGGGYHPRLFAGYLRLLGAVEQRPTIIVPISVRLALPAWHYHPRYGHAAAARVLQRKRVGGAKWRIRAAVAPPSDEQMHRHDLQPHPTFAGDDLTIGDYRKRLKDPAAARLDPAGRLALLYAYHHGAAIKPDDESVADMAEFAAKLREMRFPVVPYQTPIPVQKGVEMFGPAFLQNARDNLALLDAAFLRGYPEVDIIQTGTIFETGEFLDPEDGSEHLNEFGRRKLLDLVVSQVRTLSSAVPAQP